MPRKPRACSPRGCGGRPGRFRQVPPCARRPQGRESAGPRPRPRRITRSSAVRPSDDVRWALLSPREASRTREMGSSTSRGRLLCLRWRSAPREAVRCPRPPPPLTMPRTAEGAGVPTPASAFFEFTHAPPLPGRASLLGAYSSVILCSVASRPMEQVTEPRVGRSGFAMQIGRPSWSRAPAPATRRTEPCLSLPGQRTTHCQLPILLRNDESPAWHISSSSPSLC